MKLCVDTNILVRATVWDDVKQAEIASRVLREASLIAITLPCLCEFVWVLRKLYNFKVDNVAQAIQVLMNAVNVKVNKPAVEAGLAILKAGGDFADGVIAYEGQWLGGETFASFDRQAVLLLAEQGYSPMLVPTGTSKRA